jgi:hypothetical protein
VRSTSHPVDLTAPISHSCSNVSRPLHATLTHPLTHSPTHADWRGAPHGVCQEARVGSHPHGNGNTARALSQGYAQMRACLALLTHAASSPAQAEHAHGVSTTIALAHRHLTRAHIGHTLCSPALLAEPHKRELPKRVCLCSWLSLSSPAETSTHRSRAGQDQSSTQHAQARRCAVGITSCEARVAIRPGPFFLADLITSTFNFTSFHFIIAPRLSILRVP